MDLIMTMMRAAEKQLAQHEACSTEEAMRVIGVDNGADEIIRLTECIQYVAAGQPNNEGKVNQPNYRAVFLAFMTGVEWERTRQHTVDD